MPRAVQAQPVEKISFLEGMRGVAALYVVLGHIFSMADPSHLAGKASTAPFWLQRLSAPFAYGHIAVAAFIVISGFCLQLSLFSRGQGRIHSLRAFFIRRARRILPAYYASLAVSVAIAALVTSRLTGMPFDIYRPVTLQNVAAHVFMIHNLSPGWMYKLNGVLWSIAIEAQLYLLFPLLVASLFRFGRAKTLTMASGFAIFMLALPGAEKLYPWYLPLFALGMASAHLAYRPHPNFQVNPSGLKVASLGAGLLCLIGLSCHWSLPITDGLASLVVASLCHLGLTGIGGVPARAFSSRPLVALGGFSYSLYLMHHPIEQVVYWLKPSGIASQASLFFWLIASLPVILLLSWFFSLAFEKPFMGRPKAVTRFRFEPVPTRLPLRTLGALVSPAPGSQRRFHVELAGPMRRSRVPEAINWSRPLARAWQKMIEGPGP